MKRAHGGNRAAYTERYGSPPLLDFSANLSPLGMPAAVRAAAAASMAEAEQYPDPECAQLGAALAEKLKVPREWLLFGNGAAELLFRVCAVIRPAEALFSIPCFSEYVPALLSAHSRVIKVRAEGEQLELAADFTDHMTPETDLILLAEPNNPTGRADSLERQREISVCALERHAGVLIDESFYDFLDDSVRRSLLDELEAFPNVILLRSFTKMYAMAGLRLGYAVCSDRELRTKLRENCPAWMVSTPAQAAGLAALDETAYVRQVRELVAAERERFLRGLNSLGLRTVRGQANFILFRGPEDLGERLSQRGICIRSCADYEGLGPGWFRAGIRTGSETDRLLEEIRDILRR